mgnify:CR=1 FL=1
MKYIDAWVMVEQAVVSLVGELVVRRSSSRAVGAGRTVSCAAGSSQMVPENGWEQAYRALIGNPDTSPGYAAGGDVLIVKSGSRGRSIWKVGDNFDDASDK